MNKVFSEMIVSITEKYRRVPWKKAHPNSCLDFALTQQQNSSPCVRKHLCSVVGGTCILHTEQNDNSGMLSCKLALFSRKVFVAELSSTQQGCVENENGRTLVLLG